MKLQSLSIIFVIIAFPLILVLSYYISLQIDTVTLYNKYNNELIDATNDAMSAFELNTANEELSNVADSLRTIVDASTNTFINTFSTSLGLSNANKNEIEPYIPSILYTMYDGYYIYAPTRTPVVLEDIVKNGEIITSNGAKYYTDGSLLYKQDESDSTGTSDISLAMYKTDYVLKSYMPYSATYDESKIGVDQNGNLTTNDKATINYTLDNFMSVSAQIGDVYYTKSGYYINQNIVSTCTITDWDTKGQDQLLEVCKSGESVTIQLNDGSATSISYTARPNPSDPTKNLSIEEVEKQLQIYYDEYQILIHTMPRNDVEIINKLNEIRPLETALANIKAITYYLTNSAFSKWVNANLGFCTGKHMEIADNTLGYMSENTEIFHDFSTDSQVIFSTGNDPEDEDSTFNNHKYNIIKNSIQYNLNLSISSYNNMFQGIDFKMPQLSDNEWEDITQKISIVSFAQGLKCGLKEFNGYAVISSTNNEMTVIPEEIYYVKAGEFNNEASYYHRIDCETIRGESGDDFISFKSKEVKYDAIEVEDTTATIDYPAKYDHKNLACYDCIVQNNYLNYDSDSNGTDDKKIKLRAFLNFEPDTNEGAGTSYENTGVNTNLQKAYLIAIAKERQNLYKTTAYSKNEGIKVEELNTVVDISGERIKAEVTIEVTQTGGIVEEIAPGVSISTSSKSIQTVEINDSVTIPINFPGGAKIEVKSIKYIYK